MTRDARWTDKKRDAMEVMFKIDSILSDKGKLFDTESAKDLQLLLNQYVLGDNELEIDGQIGHKTLNAIGEYKQQRRYWMTTGPIRVNPMHTKDRYDILTSDKFTKKEVETKLDSLETHYKDISPGLYE